jgi:intein-encoded DNA endonuclease-like protein
VTEAYLLGALHNGTYNICRKTYRFSQANIIWLQILQEKLAALGYKSWIYKEGRDRTVYVLETSAKFLSTMYDPKRFTSTEQKIAYIRGFFDAEGGLPQSLDARFYIQLVQKNQPKLVWIQSVLEDLGIKCGVIHIPSKKVDPNYFRFFIATKSHKEFSTVIGSEHPRKLRIFESRMKI